LRDPALSPTLGPQRASCFDGPARSSTDSTRPALAQVFARTGTAPSQGWFQKGTKQLLAQYGDRLICVRYRYDVQRRKRLKTVELLVAESDWEPPRLPFAPDQIVGVRVAFADLAIRERVKQAGGTWNAARRVWQLRYDRVVDLGLTGRIVHGLASRSRCSEGTAENLDADARPAYR
jgi:hypothetical protein